MVTELHSLLSLARQRDASDIFLTPGSRPLMKIYGRIYLLEEFPVLQSEEILASMIQLAGQGFEHVFAQEKDMDFGVSIPDLGRFRVNAFIANKGVAAVLRVIKDTIPRLENLNVPTEQFKKLTAFQNGIVIFTGTMGSGKSSSMASLIEYMNTQESKHIVTIEDPIEFLYENKKSLIQQREVPMHSKNFHNALRGTFREAADVILLGEMRDLETMSLAMTAAETGALVFTTLHTAGAIHAIDRIIDAFPGDRQQQIRIQLSQVLRAVVWQMLLPEISEAGRVPAVEMLFNTHAVAHLIRQGDTHQIPSVMDTSRRDGMMTMASSLKELFHQGKISEAMLIQHLGMVEDES